MERVIRTRWLRLGALIALVLAAVAFALPSLCGGASGQDPDKKDAGTVEKDQPAGDKDKAKDKEPGDFRIKIDKRKDGDLDRSIDARIDEMLKRIEEMERRMDEMMGPMPGGQDLDGNRVFIWRDGNRAWRNRPDHSLPAEVEEMLKHLQEQWPEDVRRWMDQHPGQGPGGNEPFEFRINLGPGEHAFSLRMDTEETDTDYVYRLDMPGMEKDAINVEVKDNMLTISGERKEQVEEEKDGKTVKREIVYGSFKRALTLPGDADADKITSKYDNGVLTITVPKKEQQSEESRRIIVHQP